MSVQATALEEATYLPDSAESEQLGVVLDFIAEHERSGKGAIAPRYYLAGAALGERVELPQHLYMVLRQVVEAMNNGLAVTVVPRTHVLTTQQTADLLGVSRPTVIKLLDAGQIPFFRTGSHRRVRLHDVLAFREQRRAQQYAALEATAVDYGSHDDLAATLPDLRAARRMVAARRRGAATATG